MELAPLLASVCTICREEAPSAGARCAPATGVGGHRHALATAGMAGDRTEGASCVPAASTPPPHLVGPPEHMGPV